MTSEPSDRQAAAMEAMLAQYDAQAARAKAPPGWYPHPSMVGTQRYWDGRNWTDHIAPGAPPFARHDNTGSLETWGWVGAFLLPIVGLVIGIMLVNKPGKNEGGWILGISIASMVAWMVYLTWQSSQTYYY